MARGDLARRIAEKAVGNRSDAYKWLRSHYDELASVVAVRGSWQALRDAAIEAGIEIGKGENKAPPTVAALRSAWRRVVADMNQADGPKPIAAARLVVTAVPVSPAAEKIPRPLSTSALFDSPAVPQPVEQATPPRTRNKITLRSPVPLAEGEPAQSDGSRLPIPLRPERR